MTTITVPRATWDAMREALDTLLKRDKRNTCQHEETHRGGAIWEICEGCGMKWADDRGGKPKWKNPTEWDSAESALATSNAVSEPKGLFVDLIASHGPEFVAEMAAIDAEPQAQGEAAKKYAENLCISMARKFYPEVTQFEPLDDLFGLLTQIDNMTTGLVRPQATEPAWRPIETAPKDGSEILLFGDGRVTYGNWSAPSEIPRLIYRYGFAPEEEWDEWEPYWASWDGGFTEERPPTHWQPKPAAPEAKQ